jgi:hypothetical protein
MHSSGLSVLLAIIPFITSSYGAVLTYHPRDTTNGNSTNPNAAQCASAQQYISCETVSSVVECFTIVALISIL